ASFRAATGRPSCPTGPTALGCSPGERQERHRRQPAAAPGLGPAVAALPRVRQQPAGADPGEGPLRLPRNPRRLLRPARPRHADHRRAGLAELRRPGRPSPDSNVMLGDRQFAVRADRAGIVDVVLEVELSPGTHEAVLWTAPDNKVTADVTVFPEDARIGLISDLDDTVMVTWLPRPLLAFWNAFVVHQSTRKVVPGMPLLYQHL